MMWRPVQAGRTGKNMDSREDDDDLAAKVKPLRIGYSSWISKGYIVAALALVLLTLLSGVLTTDLSHSSGVPVVLKYVRAFKSEMLDLKSEVELKEPDSGSLQFSNPSNASKQAGCHKDSARLKVFMYDLPSEFHYGMISEFTPKKNQIWPQNVSDIPKYPGGLYQQHSPEYWLISDLVTSDMPDRSTPCTVFRVKRWQDAGVILIPFFASLSYNKYSRAPLLRGKKIGQKSGTSVESNLLLELPASVASFRGLESCGRYTPPQCHAAHAGKI